MSFILSLKIEIRKNIQALSNFCTIFTICRQNRGCDVSGWSGFRNMHQYGAYAPHNTDAVDWKSGPELRPDRVA
jgi:hypothetical protein